MEQGTNRVAPEASTDERASPPPTSRFADYEPVALRHRTDGWTPARQVEFLDALADTGIVRKAAAMVGVSEHSVTRLRRRAEARTFDLACEAAQRMRAGPHPRHRLRARHRRHAQGHYYHGELKSEERVYDNLLLTYLIGKVAHLLEPRPESLAFEADWAEWMGAVERGADPPGEPAQEELPYTGEELWDGEGGAAPGRPTRRRRASTARSAESGATRNIAAPSATRRRAGSRKTPRASAPSASPRLAPSATAISASPATRILSPWKPNLPHLPHLPTTAHARSTRSTG